MNLSIAAQLRALREYAKKNSQVVVREFVDEAESGRCANRPALKEMIALAKLKSPPFEAILVWKLSRFARNREGLSSLSLLSIQRLLHFTKKPLAVQAHLTRPVELEEIGYIGGTTFL